MYPIRATMVERRLNSCLMPPNTPCLWPERKKRRDFAL